jgi:hypothetical protein
MPAHLEYHRAMRYWTPVLAFFVVLLFTLFAAAQANGVPPSVTSFGFGGHPGFNGVPPSVTSYGFGGQPGFHGVAPSVTSIGPKGVGPVHAHPPIAGEPHHHHRDYVYPTYVPYYVPYYPMDAYDGSVADQPAADAPEDPAQYQGGPTIFDRRGAGVPAANDYQAARPKIAVPKPPAADVTDEDQTLATRAPDPAPPAAPSIAVQPKTILIFKDGHKQEIGNYAIVGANLFDLAPGHRMKIALSDLDLAATQKANDDEGNDFQLPQDPGGN